MASQPKESLPTRAAELLAGSERAFAIGGYFGTSTAAVAAEMGVSQPYVVQAFHSKERLFIATHEFSSKKILGCLADGLRQETYDLRSVGQAYQRLVSTEVDAVRVFAHGFSAAHVPAIGVEARRVFGEVHALLSAAGASAAEITDFFGRGMLTNALILLGARGNVVGDSYDAIVEVSTRERDAP